MLNINHLSRLENLKDIDTFEVSGGGEPLLHPQINNILSWCCLRKPTILYTNGSLLHRLDPAIAVNLKSLTISHHHYLPSKRLQIMGVSLKDKSLRQLIDLGVSVKLTLVLIKSGISSCADLIHYLDWAKTIGIKKVQVRQLFDFNYSPETFADFVSTAPILQQIAQKYRLKIQKKKYSTIIWKGITVEFEGEKCACSSGAPNLRADGNIYLGWTKELLSKKYFQL